MANTVENVTASKPKVGGAIYRAPLGTTLPASASAALDEAFESFGYISDTGLRHNIAITTNQTKAWGGDVVLNSQTDKSHTYNFEALEALNPIVLKTVNGDSNVSGDLDTGLEVTLSADELEEHAYVFDEILRNGVLKRTVIPRGSITAIAEIAANDSDPVKYGITMVALPDSALGGKPGKEYYLRPAGSTATENSGGE